MSGPICPDCNMFDIESFTDDKGRRKYRCTFCNWEGDPLPRKGLSIFQLKSYGREQKKMKMQRKENKLINFKQFMLEGWTAKPAYIRAFGWFILGVVTALALR